jgi:hypothetical protein
MCSLFSVACHVSRAGDASTRKASLFGPLERFLDVNHISGSRNLFPPNANPNPNESPSTSNNSFEAKSRAEFALFFIPLSANQIKSVEFRWPQPSRWTTYSFALNFLITFRSPSLQVPPESALALLRMQQASKPINTIESSRRSPATFASFAGANCKIQLDQPLREC